MFFENYSYPLGSWSTNILLIGFLVLPTNLGTRNMNLPWALKPSSIFIALLDFILFYFILHISNEKRQKGDKSGFHQNHG